MLLEITLVLLIALLIYFYFKNREWKIKFEQKIREWKESEEEKIRKDAIERSARTLSGSVGPLNSLNIIINTATIRTKITFSIISIPYPFKDLLQPPDYIFLVPFHVQPVNKKPFRISIQRKGSRRHCY